MLPMPGGAANNSGYEASAALQVPGPSQSASPGRVGLNKNHLDNEKTA